MPDKANASQYWNKSEWVRLPGGGLASRTFWSTQEVPTKERFPIWREAHLWPLGIVAEPHPAAPPFRAAASTRIAGDLKHIRRVADAHTVFRGAREIGRCAWGGYSIHREAGGGTWLRRGRTELIARAGDLIIADGDLPFEARAAGRYVHDVMLIPRARLQPHLPAFGRPLSLVLSNRPGVEALAAGYFAMLLQQLDGLDGAALDQAVDVFCRLVGVAAGAAAGEHREAVRAARLAEASRYIDRHLAEQDLSPARVAAGLGLSVRALHLLFEPTGTSFARHVLRRRLEECRAALAGAAGAPRSVTDIALGWGFSSLPTFYRAFRREFGVAPGDIRAAAMTDADAAGCP